MTTTSIKKIASQKDCRSLRPEDRDYSVGVKGCPRLTLRVRPNKTKEWRFTYTHPISKKKKTKTLGPLKELKVAEAVEVAKQLSELLKKGITPDSAIKTKLIQKQEVTPKTFSELAALWIDHKLAGSKNYSQSTLAYWERNIAYLNEYFGDIPPQSISTRMILAACEDKQKTNGKTVGIDMRSYCESILKFGKIRGWVTTNEAVDTRGELATKGQVKNHPTVIDRLEIGRMLYNIENLKNTKTHINTIRALTLLPHLFVRSVDLRSMRWSDIDFEKRLWTLEPKKGRNNERMVESLLVPLSDFVIKELEQQKALTGEKEYVFASTSNTKNSYMSRNVLNSAIERIGFSGKQSPHGFRATAKTVAMEDASMRFSDAVTELQLGHKIRDIHGTAYNRVEMLEERVDLMQKLSAWLESAKNSYINSLYNS